MDVGASGGYYIASAADAVMAHPSSVTGSIGVIMLTVNARGLLEKVGVEANAVTSGPRKDMGSPFRQMLPEERAIFQSVIDSFYERFLHVVREGRPNLSTEQIKKLAELIKEIDFAMLTTVEPDGSLRSRPMSTQQREFDGDLWFFTRADTPKVDEVEREQNVCVAYARPDRQHYVSVSGKARLVRDRAKIEELWNPAYKAWFPEGLDDPHLTLLRFEADGGQYWSSPGGMLEVLGAFVKAVATGKPGQGGEVGRLDM